MTKVSGVGSHTRVTEVCVTSGSFYKHLILWFVSSAAESMMVRAVLVTATSLALTGAVVAHAYLLKHQFYPTVVYLTKSSPSMAVKPFPASSQMRLFLK